MALILVAGTVPYGTSGVTVTAASVEGAVTVPDHPQALSYDPTSVKDMAAADPGTGINLIAPPPANNAGDARLSYPIEVPAGRSGMQPQLVVTYSSSSGNGWMGLGWDLAAPSISIDTRWGVPRYQTDKETESYLLAGEQLTPGAHRGQLADRAPEKLFHTRVEGEFRKIVRHGDTPSNYWWEVTSKDGTRSFYGGSPDDVGGVDNGSVLAGPGTSGNIFRWMLREVRDLHGNTIRYHYQIVNGGGATEEPWRQIYLSTIRYTGTAGGNEGAYEVQFNRAAGRPDVEVDARSGFKAVLPDRLTGVDVRLLTNPQPLIRRYQFTYTVGQFGKSLLSRITQLGEDGTTEVAHHDFTYFDDVATSTAGELDAFRSGEGFGGAQTGKDGLLLFDVRSTALGAEAANTHQAQINSGVSWLGISGASERQSYTRSDSDTNLTVVDLNGDGLPDQVYEDGGKFYFRPNIGGPNSSPNLGPAVEIATLARLPHEASETFTFGGDIAAHTVSGEAAWTWTNGDAYFSDVNGDLLPDLVIAGSGGKVLYNRLVGGLPVFGLDSPIPMAQGAASTAVGSASPLPQAVLDQLTAAAHLVDPVRRWVAPYSGTVNISGVVRLREAPSAGYGTADGVRVSVQHNGAEVWVAEITDPTDLAARTITGLNSVPVTAGDRIYFRVNSRNDGSFDEVDFDPTITYVGADPALRDENAQPTFVYHASTDYAYGSRPLTFTAPFPGTATLTGDFVKLAPTSDDVVLQILKGSPPVTLYETTLTANQTGAFPVALSLETAAEEQLQLRILTDSRIDATGISFVPRLAYNTIQGQAVAPLPNGDDALVFFPSTSTQIFPRNASDVPYTPFTAERDGTLRVRWDVETTPLTPADFSNIVTLTIKRAGERLAKQRVAITGGIVDGASALETRLQVMAGDTLYFLADTTDTEAPAAFADHVHISAPSLVYETDEGDIPAADPAFDVHLAISATEAFGGGYRQWSYGQYNGRDGAAPIVESRLRLPASQDDRIVDDFVQMAPYIEQDQISHWRAQDAESWIAPGVMRASRLGPNYLDPSGGSALGGGRGVVRSGRADSLSGSLSFQVVGGGISSGSNWSDVDFLDFNGDRYPDVVGNGRVQATLPNGALEADQFTLANLQKVRDSTSFTTNVNVGATMSLQLSSSQGDLKSISTDSKSVSLGVGAVGSIGDFTGQRDLIDINGDGLPDLVRRSDQGLVVQLNLGYRFGAEEIWRTTRDLRIERSLLVGINGSIGYASGSYSVGGGISFSQSTTAVEQDLFDVNGDGLPDIVYKALTSSTDLSSNSEALTVYLNTGNGFATVPILFKGAMRQPIRSQKTVSRNVSVQGGFSIPIVYGIAIDIGGGYSYGASLGGSTVTFSDVDGDSYPDQVYSDTEGNVQLRLNNHGRTNLLKTVRRPLGAVIDLDYTRSGNTTDLPQSLWVLSRVSTVDGHDGDGVDKEIMTYRYADGVYNRAEREFYGYGTLTEEQRDAGNGDSVYRSIVREYRTDSFYTKGLLERVLTQDTAGNPYIETQNSYRLADALTGGDADRDSTTASIFPQLTRTDTRFYEGASTPGKTTYTTFQYDALGNTTQMFDAGDTGTGDDATTSLGYAECTGTYVVGAPKFIRVTTGSSELRHRESNVNCATGDVTQVRTYLDDINVAHTDLDYYPSGMLKSVTSPPNSATPARRFTVTYDYDADVGTHVTAIRDSYGYTSRATYNVKFGQLTTSTDINGNTTSYSYDMFGRQLSVTGPYEQGYSRPTISFEYHPEAPVPYAVTHHLDRFRDPNDPIDTVVFIDGLKRVIQTKKDATVFTGTGSDAADRMIVSGHVFFDGVGRTVKQYYPVTEPKGTAGAFSTSLDTVQPTVVSYDVLDRTLRTSLPDSTSTVNAYGFASDRAGITQFRTTITDANGKQKNIYRDVRQQTTAVQEFLTRPNGGTDVLWTSYEYDSLQQLVRVIDAKNNVTTMTYDRFGRQTSIANPDSGKTEMLYDLASNLTAEITANLRAQSRRITYSYDFNRLTAIIYPNFPANNVVYTYGPAGAANNGAGRITRVTDESGKEERFYGKLGEVVKEVRTVATDTGTGPGVFTTSSTFDTFGRLQQLTYPDGEVVTYGYDAGGLPNRVTGTKAGAQYPYVKLLLYDKFAERALMVAGNDVRTQYNFRPDNRRLQAMQAGRPGTPSFQNLTYSYDQVGNVRSLKNEVSVPQPSQLGGPTTQTFAYDDLYRLTNSSGVYKFTSNKTRTYSLNLTYDPVHNIVAKQQNDAIAQPPGAPIIQGKTTYNWTYAYGSARPHAPTHIGDRTFNYDASGNQTGWTLDGSNTRRTIVWDEENRIQSITDGGSQVTYKYDDQGERVVKRGPQGETAYVNQYFSIRNGSVGTKHVYVGTTRVVAKMMRSDGTIEKDQYYFHPDQLGSTSYVTDASGALFEHVEYFPSGETWADDSTTSQRTPYLFTSKELDEETALYYYGARYYDPRTSIWASTDPVVGTALPVNDTRSLNPYAYSLQNPVTLKDPDGRCAIGSNGKAIDCIGPAQALTAAVGHETAEAWSEGNYGSAALGGLLWLASGATQITALAEEVVIAAPFNSGWNASSGFINGNYDLALQGSTELLALGLGGKLSQMAAPATSGATQALKFGSNDLVYGPSAGGALRALQQRAGGRLLTDLPGPAPSQSWISYSTQVLDEQLAAGGKIRFDLTHMDDLSGVLKGSGEYASKVTAQELRYIQSNWGRFRDAVKFYVNETEVAAPW